MTAVVNESMTDSIQAILTMVISCMTAIFNYVTSNWVLLAYIGIPLVLGLIVAVMSIFKNRGG